jgi:ribosomal protein S18 acetylase RimI-like enzyme
MPVEDTKSEGVALARHDAAAARLLADQLTDLYLRSYAGNPRYQDDPFYSGPRFLERFDGYASQPEFELVTARAGDDLVGYAFGYPLPATSRWWAALLDPLPPEITHETGSRTFALIELHVAPEQRQHGLASVLHNELLGRRPEERATLCARADNEAARHAYRSWGWLKAGRVKPYPDSPSYDLLLLDLNQPSPS